jgi:hypothetical protein
MTRLLALLLLFAAACSGSGGDSVVAILLDVNPNSTTSNVTVTPDDYLGQVSGWYFGDATSAYSRDQFGMLDRMHDELVAEQRTLGDVRIQLVGINQIGAEAGNAMMTAGRDLPWLQDTAMVDVRVQWGALDGDVIVRSTSGALVGTFNLVLKDLANPLYYEELKTLLRGGPAKLAPDFLLVDVSPTSTTSGQDVSPRDYVGQVSGYYFGAAT